MYSGQTMMQTGQSSCGGLQASYSGQMKPCVEYDRQIQYLDYMENGQRGRGAGFVKLERRDDRCNISLQVSGLYRKDHFTRPLLLLSDGEERELCKLQLADGGIKTYLEGLDSNNLDGQGLKYERLTGLRIPISEGKEILCRWSARMGRRERDVTERNVTERDVTGRNVNEQFAAVQEDTARNMDTRNEIGQSETAWDIPMQDEMGRDGNLSIQDETGQGKTAWNRSVQNSNEQRMDIGNSEMPENRNVEPDRPDARMQYNSMGQAIPKSFKEDKWEQLWAIYPHIHPFSDAREYLSFGPSDLIVLPTRYYKLVNNSFLLHGYYNYHHLIFTKVSGRNSARYYIGVPGNLNQTERRTAIMFGFESFECDREPAGEGDFGYYLIPVEL